MTGVFFGMVDRYVADRGFGFVKNELPGELWESYFFHIKELKKWRPDIAVSLEGGAKVGFWYRLDDTSKGKQAIPLTVAQVIADKTSISPLIAQIEAHWSGGGVPPLWLADVTRDLLGADRAAELIRQRREAEEEIRKQEELELKEWRARREAEEEEFAALVAEMKPLGYRESREVSDYIVKNRLGYKYKTISGFVTMEQEVDFGSQVLTRTWEFKGGFPPDIYARLCKELNLGNQKSGAVAVGFTSFEDSQTRSVQSKLSAAISVPHGSRTSASQPNLLDRDEDIPF